MPDFDIDLEIYEDTEKWCPYFESIEDIRNPGTVKAIMRRNEYYQKLKYFQLRNSDEFVDIKNSPIDGLVEVKYKIQPPYRAIAYFRARKLFLLLLMKGSGSNGKINRFVKNNMQKIIRMIKDINGRY